MAATLSELTPEVRGGTGFYPCRQGRYHLDARYGRCHEPAEAGREHRGRRRDRAGDRCRASSVKRKAGSAARMSRTCVPAFSSAPPNPQDQDSQNCQRDLRDIFRNDRNTSRDWLPCLVLTDIFYQEVYERADAGREMLVPSENGMNQFDVFRIIVLQDWNQ
jgi:hypothetical protein